MKVKSIWGTLFVVGLLSLVSSVGAIGKAEDYTYYSCSQELKNSPEDIHLVVENCTNVGTFSLGGLYQDNWEKLTFLYPNRNSSWVNIHMADKKNFSFAATYFTNDIAYFIKMGLKTPF